jgi:predicted aspartyl protease
MGKRVNKPFFLLTVVVALLVGGVLGWLAARPDESSLSIAVSNNSSSISVPLPKSGLDLLVEQPSSEEEVATGFAASHWKLHFQNLLNESRCQDALAIYENMERLDDEKFATLKQLLVVRLGEWRSNQEYASLEHCAEVFLEAYYSDTEIRLLLTLSQQQQGAIYNALDSLRKARLYAYDHEDHVLIDTVLNHLVVDEENSRSQPQRRIELYEWLQELGLISPREQLQWAGQLIKLGELVQAESLLDELKYYQQWQSQVENLLAKIEQLRLADEGIDLQRFGNHYLIDVGVGRMQLNLLIDTGASVSLLDKRRFDAIADELDYQYLGVKSVSTVGGVVEADLYRFAEVELAGRLLRDVEFLVMDFSSGGSEGLLGMNVLSRYQFQIDQQQHKLYLR